MGLLLPCCCESTPTCGMCTQHTCCFIVFLKSVWRPNNNTDAFALGCESSLTAFCSLRHFNDSQVIGCFFFFFIPRPSPCCHLHWPRLWLYHRLHHAEILRGLWQAFQRWGQDRGALEDAELTGTLRDAGSFGNLFWEEGEDFLLLLSLTEVTLQFVQVWKMPWPFPAAPL